MQSQGICVSPGAAANKPKLSIQLSAEQINKDETTESQSGNTRALASNSSDGWRLECVRVYFATSPSHSLREHECVGPFSF